MPYDGLQKAPVGRGFPRGVEDDHAATVSRDEACWPGRDSHTPLTNLHLALLERLNVRPSRLGDSTGLLEL
jgi:hypothetical protein